MKKCLIVANVISMITQFNQNNIEILQNMNVEVHVGCNLNNKTFSPKETNDKYIHELENKGVILHQIDFERQFGAYKTIGKCCRQIDDILKQSEYVFIHCHSPIAGFCGRISARRNNVKSIYTAHGFMFYKGATFLKWLLFFPQEWIQSWYTDYIITINEEDYQFAKKHLHAKNNVYIPGVGVDVTALNEASGKRAETRRQLGLKEEDYMVLSIGELNVRKNQETVIRAVSMIDDLRLKYCICGQGSKYNDLKNLILELNLSDRVCLLGYRTDIAEICHAADLFVFPSIQEGLPVALMEAMACKIPVICSNIRGNVDLVDDHACLFESKSAEEVAAKIKYMMQTNLNNLVEDNYNLICNKYSTKVVNDFLGRLYSKVLIS